MGKRRASDADAKRFRGAAASASAASSASGVLKGRGFIRTPEDHRCIKGKFDTTEDIDAFGLHRKHRVIGCGRGR